MKEDEATEIGDKGNSELKAKQKLRHYASSHGLNVRTVPMFPAIFQNM
jgi:hypothetical protein